MADQSRRGELFDSSVDLLCTVSLEGRLVDANAAWRPTLGYDPATLPGTPLQDLIHPEDFDEALSKFTSMQFGVREITLEVRMVGADGSLHWLDWRAMVSPDASHFHAVGREVTRHKVLYDVAREVPTLTTPDQVAERMLSDARILVPAEWVSIALFGQPDAPVVAWEVGAAGGPRTRLHLTAAAYGDVDVLAEGRVQRYDELTPETDAPEFIARHVEEGMRSSLKVPLSYGHEVLGALHFGSAQADAFSESHVMDALEIAGQLATALKQIRLLRAVEASEADFRSIAANADGMVIVDSNGRVRFANRAAEQLFAVDRGDLQGRLFGHPLQAEQRSEIPVRSEQGPTGVAEMRVVATEWGGEPAMLASLRDVTEQRRLESDLVQAQKMAVVGRLAGGVAHDFNNLLTAMMGHVELLRRSLGVAHPSTPSVVAIADAVDAATRVAQQVLAFSRKQVVAPRPMDVNRRVKRIEPLLRQACGEDVELHLDLTSSGSLVVYADPIQIEQVLMNLIVNARDAIEERGRVEVRTRLHRVRGESIVAPPGLKHGMWVVLSVSDTGYGMGSDTLEQIFTPFFTTKAEGKGLGLGLSTVHDIVRKSGGELHVHSTRGAGTDFQIWFPQSKERPSVDETSQEIETLPGGEERILVVDDEKALRDLLRNCLLDAGYDVLVAANAAEALALAADPDSLDLLLTDVRMPGMHGRDLERALIESRPTLRTIFMSGYSEDILAPSGVLDEGVHFIGKPFRLSALLRKVRGVLDED